MPFCAVTLEGIGMVCNTISCAVCVRRCAPMMGLMTGSGSGAAEPFCTGRCEQCPCGQSLSAMSDAVDALSRLMESKSLQGHISIRNHSVPHSSGPRGCLACTVPR